MNIDEAKVVAESILTDVAPELSDRPLDASLRLHEDLDLDSLDFLNIVDAVFERTGLTIPETDYSRIRTVGDLASYVAGSQAVTS